jgi:hypothetical protein
MLFIGSKNRKKFFSLLPFLKHLNDIIFVYVCLDTVHIMKRRIIYVPPDLAIEE